LDIKYNFLNFNFPDSDCKAKESKFSELWGFLFFLWGKINELDMLKKVDSK